MGMRYRVEVFVDRDREIDLLKSWIDKGINVLVVGLRGMESLVFS